MTNVMFSLSAVDVLEVLTEVDEKSRRSPEIIQYFIVSQKQSESEGQVKWWSACSRLCDCIQNDLQRLMASSEELCRNMAFSLALRCIQNNPR